MQYKENKFYAILNSYTQQRRLYILTTVNGR